MKRYTSFLESQDYDVIGVSKNSVHFGQQRSKLDPIDISNKEAVQSSIKKIRPDEIYFLAAYHHSSEDQHVDTSALWGKSFQVHVHSLLNFLECVRYESPNSRLFYAASSHIFGTPINGKQNENTPIKPENTYAITKAMGTFLCQFYRSSHRVFCSVGILYNHESILRSSKFISAKIVQSAIKIKQFGQGLLFVGNLGAIGDWGYAPDYVIVLRSLSWSDIISTV